MTSQTHKVLIVDDANTVRMYHRSLVEASGWSAVEAENGVEALEKCEDADFDLMLVDVNMPIMDGYTFIKQIRNSEKVGAVPIVMVSTEAQLIDRDKAFEAGANHYFVKPATPENVANLLSILSPEGAS